VRLEPPWPLLAGALLSRHGIEITDAQARSAMRAEMTYYLQHHAEGSDRASLADLRRRCAAVLGRALPDEAAMLGEDDLTEALLESLRFTPFPDAATTLGTLRASGIRAAAVSNWDCSLPDVLAGVGLAGMLDAVVTSAVVGASKPDPRIFEAALAAVQCSPARGILVGDSLEIDVEGGRAAGIRSVLLDRAARAAESDEVERIFTLDNLLVLMSGSPIV
jgi:HAD superfamily hydrolase (TIGR01509 family)